MRLVTRSDFDGLVCAMILKEAKMIDEIKFVHPKDVQDGMVVLTENDITTNLPYDDSVFLCFDHHVSELSRNADGEHSNWIIDGNARSAARVVYNYYKEKCDLTRISDELMAAVDKSDSADFSREEILNPEGWVLMSFIMDSRTGLGRFHNFRISNYDFMMKLIDLCLEKTLDEILQDDDVKERVELYFSHQEKFKEQLDRIARIDGRCIVVDLREENEIYTGSRFLVYALYPDVYFSIHIAKGKQRNITPLMIGKSILKDGVDKNIGEICLKYDGGGHKNAGTCQLSNDKVDTVLTDILSYLNS